MNIKETKKEKSVALVEVILTKKEIDIEKDHAIEELSSKVTVKGFRQGKAPKHIAQQQIDPEKITDHVLSHVLQDAVGKVLSEQKYNLLGRPVLENVDTQGKEGWKLTLSFPLYPEFDLGDYKKQVKKAVKPAVKTKKTEAEVKPENQKAEEEQKQNLIYQALLSGNTINIPQSVIDEEVNYSLQRLQSQAQALHLSLENYLKAVNKSLDQVKADYAKNATDSLKLDLILLSIAKKENIIVSDKEVRSLAKSTNLPDNQLSRLKAVLERRKTLEYLSTL